MMQYKAVITKITSANLCMPIDDIINYFTFILLNLKSVERKGISRERKELFR